MKVLIIEDEKPAAEKLRTLLAQYDPGIQVAQVLASVTEGIAWLRTNEAPELIFTDIHLEDGLCFEIFRQVNVVCPVIFCTAFDEYALQAFEFNSIDYLLKPVQFGRLQRSLDKMKSIQQRQPVSAPVINDLMAKVSVSNPANYKSRFMVKIGNRIKAIKTDEIAYFHSSNKLTMLITRDGSRYPVDYSLDDLIGMLNPDVFFQVNRGVIIHIDAAKEIHPYFKGRMKLVLHPAMDEEVIISSQRTPLFKIWLDK